MNDALEILRNARVPGGLVASVQDRANYRRVWARDAVICGLAGVAARDAEVIAGLAASLETLAAAAGPHGEIPSNAAATRGGAPPSYGGLAGRIDANAWFVIGACALATTGADIGPLVPAIERALDLYDVWELNGRGLVYTPPGGCWADEYPIAGYTATEQLLRLWALREAGAVTGQPERRCQAASLAERIALNYYIDETAAAAPRYHPAAFRRAGRCDHLASSLSPAGYQLRFDALANALAIRLEVGELEQRRRAASAGKRIAAELGGAMAPAFWPPIRRGDREWPDLEAMAAYELRNHPGAYHNGGRWPMVNGFWGEALLALGDRAAAQAVLADIRAANRAEPRFSEFVDSGGRPGGAAPTTWSAAAEIWLAAALKEDA